MYLRRLGPFLRAETGREHHLLPPLAPSPSGSAASPPAPDGPKPDGPDGSCLLLELPEHVLLEVLSRLDVAGLSALAQTCRYLHTLSGTPSLWPDRRLGGPLVTAVRLSIASILHVPPQLLHVRLEEGRSSKFPLSVPLHNLRSVLAAPDVDALAERTSVALQDRIDRAPAVALYYPASAALGGGVSGGGNHGSRGGVRGGLAPSAALSVCRADRGSVRVGLQPPVAVARVLWAAAASGGGGSGGGGGGAAAAEPPSTSSHDLPLVAERPETMDTQGPGRKPVGPEPAGRVGVGADGMAAALLAADCLGGTSALTWPPGGSAAAGSFQGAAAAAAEEVDRIDGCDLTVAAAAAAAQEEEAAVLRVMAYALAGGPQADGGAREAWRAFVAGCRQAAATHILLAAQSDTPAMAPAMAAALQPPPLPQWPRSGTEADTAAPGLPAADHGAVSPSSAPAVGPPHLQLQLPLCAVLPPAPPTAPRLHATCAAVRLRLAALLVRGVDGDGGGAVGGGGGEAVGVGMGVGVAAGPLRHRPPGNPGRQDVRHILARTWQIALVYGRLAVTAAALQDGFASASLAASAGGRSTDGRRPDTDAAAAAGGAAAGRVAGSAPPPSFSLAPGLPAGAADDGGEGGDGAQAMAARFGRGADADTDVASAAAAAAAGRMLDVAAAASGADANLCLTTFEALLETRAAVRASATAAAAPPAAATAVASSPPPSGAPSPMATVTAAWPSGNGGGEIAAGRPGFISTDPRVTDACVRRLYGLLSETLIPAAARLLTAPQSYSPLGVVLPPAAAAASPSPLSAALPPPVATGGDAAGGAATDGGGAAAAAAAARAGAALARAAVSGVDALDECERREALRGLLAAYMLRAVTWALRTLGAL